MHYLYGNMSEMLHIGYDAKRLFLNHSGLGNYARALVGSMLDFHSDLHVHLYTPDVGVRPDTAHLMSHDRVSIHTPPRGMPGTLWRTMGILKGIGRDNIQLYHGLSNEVPIGVNKSGVPSVATIHDLIFRHYPEHYSRVDRAIFNGKTKYACEQATAVLAISEATKRDIMAAYNTPEEKIRVIYQSCAPRFFHPVDEVKKSEVNQRYKLPEAFILYVGTVNVRKNLLRLVEAIQLLPSELKIPLVVVGQPTSYQKKVEKYIQTHHMADSVHFHTDVMDDDLPAIYQRALLMCMPSLYEGFGLQILEAIASGCPVVAGNRSSLPEAGGPGTAYADPENPEALASEIARVLESEDIRMVMSRLGRDYASQFTGAVVSQQLYQLYQEIIQ